jgi:hypothetical protein
MKTKEVDHKKFKIGQMVKVLWRGDMYTGKYYGWAVHEKRHMVRFPVCGPQGFKLQILLVRDKDCFSTMH